MRKLFALSALSVAMIAAPTFTASAAGFQVTTHSATGNGRANAGEAAIADNASVLARNPAAMTRFESAEISGGINVIAPTTDVTGISYQAPVPVQAVPVADQNDVTQTTPVPNLYYIQPINDRLAVGFAANTNFGTTTEFSEDFHNAVELPGLGKPLGLTGGKTRVYTINLNTSVAYKLTERLSLGLGVNAIYGEGEFKRSAPTDIDGVYAFDVDFKGEGWDYAFDFGALYEVNENHRFALTYRTGSDFTADGDAQISTLHPQAGPITIDVNSIKLNLPDMAEFAGYHKLTDKFAMHYSVNWTGWSDFKTIDFIGDNGAVVYQNEYGWDNAMRYAIGGTYELNQKVVLRAGIAYDSSPIPEDKRIISIPDSNRWWYSAGASYHFSDSSSLDFGITYINGEATDVVEPIAGGSLGTLSATTKTTAVIAGLQYNHRF
ncbi:OmpP1/FadL family transporter [Paraferrimonas haliotis]|uniref:Long-chain fatty acid transporter n=1 Tax=Paraferrimonas haliotis TaxID=2013866 RepID=A0AA37TWA8_9GAMM|nr:OmpP1/FadL family transporter [Paraferrimonas haliotis]GLS84961.1 long-chain fatty acid transporter [Paraferrimonas haliotis]